MSVVSLGIAGHLPRNPMLVVGQGGQSVSRQQLLVNGVDLSEYCEQSSWSAQQEFSRQGDTADFYLYDEHPWETQTPPSLSFVVPPLSTVQLIDPNLGTTIFSGVVTVPEMSHEGPNLTKWHLPCRDWTFLMDMTIVVGDFVDTPADQIVISLFSQFPCGINAISVDNGGYVQHAPILSRCRLHSQTITSALKQIEGLSSNIGAIYGFYVDENLNLHFYNQSQAYPSGVTLTDVVTAPATPTLGYYDRNWTYSWDGTDIRNDIQVRGGDLTATTGLPAQTDRFLGDGTSTNFLISYVPDTNPFTCSVTVNGVGESIGQDLGVDPTTQWVLSKSSTMLGIGRWILKSTSLRSPVPDGQVIQITYNRIQPVVTQYEELVSIAQFQSLPNSGHFQMYIADPTLLNVLAAKDRAEREAAEYSLPQERVVFETTEDWPGHIRAGSTFQFVSSIIPDSQNSYAPGLNSKFLCIRNNVSGKPGINRRYKITAIRIV